MSSRKSFCEIKWCDYLQAIFDHQIKPANLLNIQVKSCTSESIVLTAPLAVNHNDKSTAFGGSIYSLLVLSAWGLLKIQSEWRSLSAEIVIAESNIHFKAPVTGDLQAKCTLSNDSFNQYADTFQSREKVRIPMQASLIFNGSPAAIFTGTYVLYPKH